MTTPVVIRPAVGDDADAVAAVRREVYSYKVMSPAATRYMITVRQPAERFSGNMKAIAPSWTANGNSWRSRTNPGDFTTSSPTVPSNMTLPRRNETALRH